MEQKNNMALASMVLGIVSIVLSCCCYLGFMSGSLAVVFALLSRVVQKFSGHAVAGLVTGIVGIILGIVSLIIWIRILSD